MKRRVMNSALADSPKGGKEVSRSDVSEGKTYLRRITESKPTKGFITPTEDASQLLERVASARNLAQALLNVARNNARDISTVTWWRVERVRGQRPGRRIAAAAFGAAAIIQE